MAIPSGLGATIGFADEVTVGTFVTPARWLPFEKETFKGKKTVAQSKALSAGQLYMRSDRRILVAFAADGAVDMDLVDRQLGLMLKHMLGSTPTPTLVSPSATVYRQVHVPGSALGYGLSVQVGRPDTTGTMRAFSYGGGKVTDWEIGVAAEQIATLNLTLDAWSEDTSKSYGAPSYIVPNVFHFAGGSVLIGGTATTSSGVTSVSGATTLLPVRGASVKGTNKLDTGRFYLGQTVKAEQVPNDFRDITGTLEIEFENLTDIYTAFAADTSVALQLNFTGPLIDTPNSLHSSLSVLIPSIRWEEGVPEVAGPGVLTVQAPFTGLYDGTNNQIQITYTSLDSAL